MPKFFATTDNGDGPVRDETPLDYPDTESAAADAQRALADMAHDELPNGPERLFRISLEDEGGKMVYAAELKFKSARSRRN